MSETIFIRHGAMTKFYECSRWNFSKSNFCAKLAFCFSQTTVESVRGLSWGLHPSHAPGLSSSVSSQMKRQEEVKSGASLITASTTDYSLKEGEKIKVDLVSPSYPLRFTRRRPNRGTCLPALGFGLMLHGFNDVAFRWQFHKIPRLGLHWAKAPKNGIRLLHPSPNSWTLGPS